MAKTPIDPKLLDELLQGQDPKDVFTSDGLLGDLKQALAQRILDAEMDHHLEQPEQRAHRSDHRTTHSTTHLGPAIKAHV